MGQLGTFGDSVSTVLIRFVSMVKQRFLHFRGNRDDLFANFFGAGVASDEESLLFWSFEVSKSVNSDCIVLDCKTFFERHFLLLSFFFTFFLFSEGGDVVFSINFRLQFTNEFGGFLPVVDSFSANIVEN